MAPTLEEQAGQILDADVKKDEATSSPASTALLDEGAFFEGEILAYRELIRIAGAIAGIIAQDDRFRKLVLLDKQEIAMLPAFEAFQIQAKLLRDRYREIAEITPEKALESLDVTGVVGAVTGLVNVLSLFHTGVQVSGRELSPDESALVAELAHALQGTTSVVYPSAGPRHTATDGTTGEIWKALQEVWAAKDAARQSAAGNAELQERLDAVNSQFDAFLAELAKTDESSVPGILTTLARAEALHASLQNAHVLSVKIVRGGIGRRVVENFFTRFSSNRTAYSGGAVVTFMIFDRDGTILLSRTLYSHSGYTKFEMSDLPFETGRNF